MKKLFRKNHWSNEDKMLAAVGVVAAVGLFVVVKQKRDAAAAVSGLRGLRGMGAYFQDPMNIPISGLGSNYVGV
jgi:hypothetical protein